MRTFPGCLLPSLCALALAALPLLSACDQPVPDGTVDGSCPDTSHAGEAWFEAEILPIFEAYCTLCHSSDLLPGEGHETRRGAPRGLDYDLYETAVSRNSSTWTRMADRTMPPMGRTPSTEELEILLDFLNCETALGEQGDDDDSSL